MLANRKVTNNSKDVNRTIEAIQQRNLALTIQRVEMNHSGQAQNSIAIIHHTHTPVQAANLSHKATTMQQQQAHQQRQLEPKSNSSHLNKYRTPI